MRCRAEYFNSVRPCGDDASFIYRDADGSVRALCCLHATSDPSDGTPVTEDEAVEFFAACEAEDLVHEVLAS